MADSWETITLAEKIPVQTFRQSPRLVPYLIGKFATGLHVEYEIKPHEEWLTIRARGQDSSAFLNLLKQELGEAPVSRAKVERWDVCKGFVTAAGKVGFGIYVDIGILQPTKKDSLYPLHRMRAQLADGNSKSAREILTENGMSDYFPVQVIINDIEADRISVELTDVTREMFGEWKRFPFDRVVATGIDKERAEKIISQMKLNADVIEVDSLSLLVQVFVCKIDTDAPGIIARIGKKLPGVNLTAFHSPRKIELGLR